MKLFKLLRLNVHYVGLLFRTSFVVMSDECLFNIIGLRKSVPLVNISIVITIVGLGTHDPPTGSCGTACDPLEVVGRLATKSVSHTAILQLF